MRITPIAAVAVLSMLATAPASSAAVGHNSGAHQHGSQVKKQVTHFTATYDVPEYYGGVSCTGVHVVSAAFPGGKDIETCTSTEGKLSHMTTGTGQTTFANSSGGFTSGWDSDYDGVYTSDYTFSVNRKLTRFRLIAIFPAPES